MHLDVMRLRKRCQKLRQYSLLNLSTMANRLDMRPPLSSMVHLISIADKRVSFIRQETELSPVQKHGTIEDFENPQRLIKVCPLLNSPLQEFTALPSSPAHSHQSG